MGGFDRPAYIFESPVGTSLCCCQGLCYNSLSRGFLLVASVCFLREAATWERVWQRAGSVSGCWSLTFCQCVPEEGLCVLKGQGRQNWCAGLWKEVRGSAQQGPPYRRGWGAMGANVQQCRGMVGRKHLSNLLRALCKEVNSLQAASPDQLHVCEVLRVPRRFGGLS